MHSVRKAGVLLSMCVLTAFAGAQIVMTSALPPNVGFVDLSLTGGTPLTNSDDTQNVITTTVGNALFPAGSVAISNNGVAIAGIGSNPEDVSFSNGSLSSGLPSGVPPTGVGYAFPFWDDLQVVAGSENTTVYWQEVAGVLYIMWKDQGHFLSTSGQTVTFEMQVFSNPAPCGPSIQYLYADTAFGGPQAIYDDGMSATIGYVGNGPLNPNGLQWSFNVLAVVPGIVISTIDASAGFAATSPLGPGSLQLDYGASSCSSAGSGYVLAATLNQGNFPNGWLAGVDMPVPELMGLISSGAPFVGTGSAFQIGPFTGLPPITFYAVVLTFDASSSLTGHSSPVSYTIP